MRRATLTDGGSHDDHYHERTSQRDLVHGGLRHRRLRIGADAGRQARSRQELTGSSRTGAGRAVRAGRAELGAQQARGRAGRGRQARRGRRRAARRPGGRRRTAGRVHGARQATGAARQRDGRVTARPAQGDAAQGCRRRQHGDAADLACPAGARPADHAATAAMRGPVMKQLYIALAAVLTLSFIGACETKPQDSGLLTQARSAVAQAEADPNVSKYAPNELERARRLLTNAEGAAKEKGADDTVTSHYAYLATQMARISEQRAHEQVATARIKAGEVERQQIL